MKRSWGITKHIKLSPVHYGEDGRRGYSSFKLVTSLSLLTGKILTERTKQSPIWKSDDFQRIQVPVDLDSGRLRITNYTEARFLGHRTAASMQSQPVSSTSGQNIIQLTEKQLLILFNKDFS